MIIQKIETWWVRRNKCLFDDKRKGKSAMDWDVLVLKLTTDTGIEGIATALAARSGNVTEAYIHDNIAPVVLGRSPYDHEKIWHELWNIDRHLTFFHRFQKSGLRAGTCPVDLIAQNQICMVQNTGTVNKRTAFLIVN